MRRSSAVVCSVLIAGLPGCATKPVKAVSDQEPAASKSADPASSESAEAVEASFTEAWQERIESERRAQEGDAADAPGEAAVDADAGTEPGEVAQAAGDQSPVSEPMPPILTAGAVSMWGDAEFRRELAESYRAETEIEPSVTLEEREVMLGVFDLIAEDNTDEALQLVRDNQTPESSAVFDFTLANLHFQRGELDEAVQGYQLSVQKFPKFRRAWGNLGQILFQRGDYDGAVDALTEVVKLEGDTSLIYGLLGYTNAQLENDVAAESAYRMAAMLEPANNDWKVGLAESLFKQERFDAAVALLDDLIAAAPDRPEFWLYQGQAYARLGRPLQAALSLEMVDRLGGATADTLNNLGDIYAVEGLYGLAVGAYVRALKCDVEARLDRAVRAATFLAANRAVEEARTLVDGIEEVRGDDLAPEMRVELLKVRARLALAQGASDDEARILEEVVELDPLDGDALLLLGQHSRRNEEFEKAMFYFERAESLEKFEPDALVGRAQVLVGLGKFGEALPLLRRAQTLRPQERLEKYLDQVERLAQTKV